MFTFGKSLAFCLWTVTSYRIKHKQKGTILYLFAVPTMILDKHLPWFSILGIHKFILTHIFVSFNALCVYFLLLLLLLFANFIKSLSIFQICVYVQIVVIITENGKWKNRHNVYLYVWGGINSNKGDGWGFDGISRLSWTMCMWCWLRWFYRNSMTIALLIALLGFGQKIVLINANIQFCVYFNTWKAWL